MSRKKWAAAAAEQLQRSEDTKEVSKRVAGVCGVCGNGKAFRRYFENKIMFRECSFCKETINLDTMEVVNYGEKDN